MADEDKKFSQEDIDQIKAELEATRAAHAELKAENTDLKAENTDLKAQIADQAGKMKNFELKAQKAEIAKKAGLADSLADRLQGTTPEELEADAKSLAEALGPGPSIGAGTNPPTGAKRPFTRADLKKMSSEEITTNWNQIRSQLKDGSLSRA